MSIPNDRCNISPSFVSLPERGIRALILGVQCDHPDNQLEVAMADGSSFSISASDSGSGSFIGNAGMVIAWIQAKSNEGVVPTPAEIAEAYQIIKGRGG